MVVAQNNPQQMVEKRKKEENLVSHLRDLNLTGDNTQMWSYTWLLKRVCQRFWEGVLQGIWQRIWQRVKLKEGWKNKEDATKWKEEMLLANCCPYYFMVVVCYCLHYNVTVN